MRTPSMVVLALALSACTPSAAVSVRRLSPGELVEGVKGDNVKFRRGSQEPVSNVQKGYFAVRSHEDWANLHMTTEPPQFPPTLDVTRSMLVVAVGDPDAVMETKVTRMVEGVDALHVWVKEMRRGEGCVTKPEHAPTDAVITSRVDKPVRFYVEGAVGESCGDAPTATIQCRLEGSQHWFPKLDAKPGDVVECELAGDSKGKFAIIDRNLTLGEIPLGSGAKLTYNRGTTRGTFAVDVFGKFAVRGEVTDDGSRRANVATTVEALPPKSRDAIVQLTWQNFDASDDPDTFPRLKLRASDPTPKGRECSADKPLAGMCDVKVKSAYTHMRLPASDAKVALAVTYVDERVDGAPLACIQVFYDGTRTVEVCDRKHRAADEKWEIGLLDMTTGKLAE